MIFLYIIFAFVFSYFIFKVIYETIKKPDGGITFIASEIGSGKSCFAAKISRKYLKRGYSVYSNEAIRGCYQLSVSQLENFCCPPKSLLIIDEASLEMNARSFAKMAIKMIEYFKLSRHYKNEIIMISQTFGDTDKQIRELASKVFIIRPLIKGLISMPVRCRGQLGIGLDGNFCVQYKIGHIGIPFILPLYFKYYNSYSSVNRSFILNKYWFDSDAGLVDRGEAPLGATPHKTFKLTFPKKTGN